MRTRSVTFWLIIANVLVIVAVVYLTGQFLDWWRFLDWENILGIKMQGPNKWWFYFGAALFIGGPAAAIPFYIKRCCQKCHCRGCGRQHIQRF